MTRTELREWQRRFEWTVLRADRRAVHDLFDHIQVVDLAGAETRRRVDREHELFDDIAAAAEALQKVARSIGVPAPASCGVWPAFRDATARFAANELALAPSMDGNASVAMTATELEYVIATLCAAYAPVPDDPIDLVLRERPIEGRGWLEIIVRGTGAVIDEHGLAVVETIVGQRGGEYSRDGQELVVALPLT